MKGKMPPAPLLTAVEKEEFWLLIHNGINKSSYFFIVVKRVDTLETFKRIVSKL
jgi:hypothetical protein